MNTDEAREVAEERQLDWLLGEVLGGQESLVNASPGLAPGKRARRPAADREPVVGRRRRARVVAFALALLAVAAVVGTAWSRPVAPIPQAASQDPRPAGEALDAAVAERLQTHKHWQLVYTFVGDEPAQQAVEAAVEALRERLRGAALVSRRGDAGVLVELPWRGADGRAGAENLGQVRRIAEWQAADVRLVARPPSTDGRLAAAAAALRDWLQAGGRQELRDDPRAIDEFNATLGSEGLRFAVHRVGMDPLVTGRWAPRLADADGFDERVVAAYSTADWNDGTIPLQVQRLPADQRFLLEVVPVQESDGFGVWAIDPERLRAAQRDDGCTVFRFEVRAEHMSWRADWSETRAGRAAALIVDGEIVASTVLRGRTLTFEFAGRPSAGLRARFERAVRQPIPPATVVSLKKVGPRPAGK